MSSNDELLVALDIGTTKICCLVAAYTEDGALNIKGIGVAPSTGLNRGRVINMPDTINAIKSAVTMAKEKSGEEFYSAYVGIAGDHIRGKKTDGSTAIRNGTVTPDDIERAIKSAMVMKLPDNSHVLAKIPLEYHVDAEKGIVNPINMTGTKLAVFVHVFTADRNCLDNLAHCVDSALVKINDIFLESVASAEAVLTVGEKQQGVVLLDVGGGTCDMAIYLNGAVHHIYEVPLAGDALSHALATNLNISLDTAERLKITHGCCHDSVLVDDYQIDLASLDGAGSVTVGIDVVTQILRRHVTELLDIVNTNIIHSGYDHLVKNVVLTGGTSLLNGFPELAKDILVRSVRVGYPRVSGAIDRDVDNPMFSTAVGLILYGQSHQARVSGTQPAEMGRIAKAIQAVRGIFNG